MNTPSSVLVIATRRIGDVLLTTPLIRSIKRAWPNAAIDALVFEGTQGILAGNPDLRRVIAIAERPSHFAHLRFIASLWGKYEVALSTMPGDRPTMYAWAVGQWRAGILNAGMKSYWKRLLLSDWRAQEDRDAHATTQSLMLADLLKIPRRHDVVVSWSHVDAQVVDQEFPSDAASFAVLHIFPKFNYKMWHEDGWLALAQWLANNGLVVVLSGSGAADEMVQVDRLAKRMPASTINLAGRFTLNQTAYLISRARLYTGPDTVTTHMAAALGVPTIALFGPSDPQKWGPWPKGHVSDASPYRLKGTQRLRNVYLLQGEGHCVPCLLEGCDRHIASFSDCLQQLPAARVIAAAQEMLKEDYKAGGTLSNLH